jgi:xanthine dehydrogenase accessory factor
VDRPEDRLARAADLLACGHPVVRAVIVRTWGSTPREVGADMLVDHEGRLHGTVGGGCGEAEVYELARELLQHPGGPGGYLYHVDLTENPDEGGEKVCGGRFDVLLHRLDPVLHGDLVVAAKASLREHGQLSWRTGTGEHRPGFWKQGLLSLSLEPRLSLGSEMGRCPGVDDGPEVDSKAAGGPVWTVTEAGENEFRESLGQALRLIIVGAGHIARPLSRLANEVGYRVAVLDDRAEYARPELFPDAAEVVIGDYQAELPRLAAHPCTSVVLVTRGHKHDQDCLRLMATEPLDYLGMIGSRRRIDAVFAELREEGVDADSLARVRAPIGLEIGARTPAEIAVSILAQMIQLRRRPGVPARLAESRQRHTRRVK